MNIIKKKGSVISIIILALLFHIFSINLSTVFATDETTYISLSDENITVNNQAISTNTSSTVYLTSIMDNGCSNNEATEANIQITNIINITQAGTYEFTGNLSDGQISVNSNNINGDITIVLNNVNITCKSAPAIFVYNKDNNCTTCNIIIKTATGSTNTVKGGKIKQSVEGWEDQSDLLYYLDKGTDDEGKYYERYKYDGAISSDISLTFEGDGLLTIISEKKEGIEAKKDITFNSGNYVINTVDDGINGSADNESVITINGGALLINLTSEAEEGDAIDSNGTIVVNDGKVYAFACEASDDSGLDSDLGIYINGGYVVATGNMADEIKSSSTQSFMLLQFNEKVSKETLITITDENDNPIVAFKSEKDYSVLAISTPDLGNGNHNVYEGGNIEGNSENGLYLNISSFSGGTTKEYSNGGMRGQGMMPGNDMNRPDMLLNNMNNNDNIYYYILAILAVLLILVIIIYIVYKKKEE